MEDIFNIMFFVAIGFGIIQIVMIIKFFQIANDIRCLKKQYKH